MLSDFIEKALAQIDDLAELKVTLVALRLLEAKHSETASVTEREILTHAAVQSLSMPELTMRFALQKALSRGTLIGLRFEARVGEGHGESLRYFANNEASRRMIEAIEGVGKGGPQTRPYDAVAKEIERLELVEAYSLTNKDRALLDEWAAQGYAQDEVIVAVREALKEPRPKTAPARTLSAIKQTLTAQPPHAPSPYYRVVVAGDEKPSEEILALRELMRRWPNGREFETVRGAVALFGARAVVDGLKRIAQGRQVDVNELVPLLAEQEDADLTFERNRASVDVAVRELTRLYEGVMGTPPTEYIARDIKSIYDSDVQDMLTWRAVFEYAARQGKTDWRYVRALLLKPSPNVFMPQAASPIAQFGFDEYKRRVGRLDPSVANEINVVAQTVPDEIRWRAAFDAAAKANALNWNYIKKVLTSADTDKQDKQEKTSDGKRKRATKPGKTGATYRREQVEYDDERRAAARERAKQRVAQRGAKGTNPPKPEPKV